MINRSKKTHATIRFCTMKKKAPQPTGPSHNLTSLGVSLSSCSVGARAVDNACGAWRR
jgi:hypothetical protein